MNALHSRSSRHAAVLCPGHSLQPLHKGALCHMRVHARSCFTAWQCALPHVVACHRFCARAMIHTSCTLTHTHTHTHTLTQTHVSHTRVHSQGFNHQNVEQSPKYLTHLRVCAGCVCVVGWLRERERVRERERE